MNENLLLIGFVRPMRPICKKNQHVSVRFVFLTFVTLKIDGNLLFPAKKSKGHSRMRQPCRSRRRRIGVQKIAILRSFFGHLPLVFAEMRCFGRQVSGYLSLPGMQDSCRGIINDESQSKSTGFFWSGKRGSDPRPQPWQGCALPTELFPQNPIA